MTSSMCSLIKEICKPLKSYTHHTLIDHEAMWPLSAKKLHYNHSLQSKVVAFMEWMTEGSSHRKAIA